MQWMTEILEKSFKKSPSIAYIYILLWFISGLLPGDIVKAVEESHEERPSQDKADTDVYEMTTLAEEERASGAGSISLPMQSQVSCNVSCKFYSHSYQVGVKML